MSTETQKMFQAEKLAQAMMWEGEICLEDPPKERVVFKTTSFAWPVAQLIGASSCILKS